MAMGQKLKNGGIVGKNLTAAKRRLKVMNLK
jgi:hypothetical protein